MIEAHRKRLLAALMQDCPSDLKEIEELCLDDLKRMEPIIDDIEKQAEMRGRFQALLEQAEHWGKALARAKTTSD